MLRFGVRSCVKFPSRFELTNNFLLVKAMSFFDYMYGLSSLQQLVFDRTSVLKIAAKNLDLSFALCKYMQLTLDNFHSDQ